jgi:hypothetical protein
MGHRDLGRPTQSTDHRTGEAFHAEKDALLRAGYACYVSNDATCVYMRTQGLTQGLRTQLADLAPCTIDSHARPAASKACRSGVICVPESAEVIRIDRHLGIAEENFQDGYAFQRIGHGFGFGQHPYGHGVIETQAGVVDRALAGFLATRDLDGFGRRRGRRILDQTGEQALLDRQINLESFFGV